MSKELNFNLSPSDLEANSLPPILSHPTISKASLVSVQVETIKGKNDTEYEVIDFNFKILDGDYKGNEFRHRVFGYTERKGSEDPTKDQNNWGKRLCYVMNYFIGESNALKIMNASDNTWEKIRANVNKAFTADALIGWKEKVVRIKVGGYKTRSGKAVLGFALYLGFISDAESEAQVSFSKRELQQNAQYEAAYAREISATSSSDLNSSGAEGVETGMEF